MTENFTGWMPLIELVAAKHQKSLNAESKNYLQFKEKFGFLEFRGINDELTQSAHALSPYICMICGAVGALVQQNHYVHASCAKCLGESNTNIISTLTQSDLEQMTKMRQKINVSSDTTNIELKEGLEPNKKHLPAILLLPIIKYDVFMMNMLNPELAGENTPKFLQRYESQKLYEYFDLDETIEVLEQYKKVLDSKYYFNFLHQQLSKRSTSEVLNYLISYKEKISLSSDITGKISSSHTLKI